MIVKVAVFDVAPIVAVIFAVVVAVTAAVFATKMPEVFPDAMVTDPGTVAEPLLLERETEIPPIGAAVPMVTVPLDVFPPFTEAGLSVRPVSIGGFIVRLAEADAPFKFPVIVATV